MGTIDLQQARDPVHWVDNMLWLRFSIGNAGSSWGVAHWLDPVMDADVIASDKQECEELCRLLSQLDEDEIELYGAWEGHEDRGPLIREEIALDDIRREYFRFKEGGFYRVKLR